jgi:hypothetical protein
MIGRERELELLLTGLDGLRSGRGRLFLLTGEPGIGKTRLADELCERAAARSAHCAWGAAWDGGGAPAYWPWIQALRALRAHFGDPDTRLQRDLGPLWGEGAGDDDEHARDPEMVRFRRFDALRAVLASASSNAPVVLVLDDLHAADRGSLLALQFLARALRECPVLIVGTHRDAEARLDRAVGEMLARVAREGTTIALRRLDEPHVAELMGDLDHITPELIAAVHETSGGNPLFVEEVVRWVRMGGDTREVPDGVRAIIDDRIGRLDENARAVLGMLAVLGREADWDTLAYVARLEVAALRTHLRTAALAGIVTIGPIRVRFAHALFRESLYSHLEAHRAQEIHLHAAEALSRDPTTAHAESVARHRIAALPCGDAAQTVAACMRAAHRAVRALAFDRAAALFEGALNALQLLPPDPVQRVDAMLGLSEALGRAGATERGGAVCLAAAEAARAMGDGARLCAAALAYGAQFRIGLVDPVLVSLLEEGLAALAPSDRALRARVMARLAAAQQPAPEPRRPVAQAREAIALAREVGDPETLLLTLFTAGSALVDYAPPAERARLNREIVALALPRSELVIAQHAYLRLAVDYLELGDIAGADLAVAANERLGQALGHARWRWRGPLLRSMRALMDGRWDDSDAAIAEAMRLAQQAEDSNATTGIALHRVGALLAREAASVAEADALWTPAMDRLGFASTWMPVLRAATAARLGHVEIARTAVLSPPPGAAAMHDDPMYLSLIGEILAESAQHEKAEEVLPHAEMYAADYLTWGVFGLIWAGPRSRMVASVLRGLGRWDEAATMLEDALANVDAIGARPLATRVRLELAIVLSRRELSGDAARARILLDEATEIAKPLQMTHLLARIRAISDAMRAEPARTQPAGLAVAMRREGELWVIAYGDQIAHIRHSRALDILAQLVASPGREFHVLDLAAGGDAADLIDIGDAGEALDEQAKASYKQRIVELDVALAEAERWADSARRERLQAEAEFLREELARASGVGGRDRRAARAAERARVNVQKRVRGAIQRIGEVHPELGRHLQEHITTGVYVSYTL